MLVSYNTLGILKKEFRRKEAHAELIKLKSTIEQLAISNNKSAIDIATTISPTIKTPNGYYTITATTDPNNNSYTLTATPTGLQAQDTSCPSIALIISADQEDIKSPKSCW